MYEKIMCKIIDLLLVTSVIIGLFAPVGFVAIIIHFLIKWW